MRFPKSALIGLAAGSALLLSACRGLAPSPPPAASASWIPAGYVEGVPFYPEEKYQCGPASLAAVLNYWGQRTSVEEVAEEIYLPEHKGSLSIDLWRYATARGFEAQMRQGSLELLAEQVSRRRPVIAFLNRGFRFMPVGHFLVVVGIDPDQEEIIAYSGTEKDKRISFDKFLGSWEKTDYWSLLIRPKGQG